MGVPVKIDVSQTGVGETSWKPLNRWGSGLHRVYIDVTGTAAFTVHGTQDYVNRMADPSTAEEMPVLTDADLDGTSLMKSVDLLFEAVKLEVTSGTGTVRMRVQAEGD